ncbi:MAG: flagellar hook-associated protein FlgK [Deltaproteobacteria bacterium]|nr:flagellar hook-associated protein FlgK [Deltaproteobacteria bacterium]
MASIGIDSLLDISRRALYTQSQSVRVIGNNIANVNTEGYSRRKAEIVSTKSTDLGAGAFGTGADIEKVVRLVDDFVNKELLARINDRSEAEIKDEFLERAEATFSLDAQDGRIGYELSKFFSALEDLQASPSSIPLRSGLIQQGQILTDTIRSAYQVIAGLQREADTRMQVLVGEVNRICSDIAGLNSQIVAGEKTLQQNLTLRDKRDSLMQELSEIISVRTVENSDGSLIVTLENGFGLVTGIETNALSYSLSPSFAQGNPFPPGLDGGAMGFIVHDFDDSLAGESHVDLSSTIASGGGELAGILNLRGLQSDTDTSPFDATGELVDMATYIELLSRDLLTRFNAAYLGDDEDTGTAVHDASSGDLNGNPSNTFLGGIPQNTFGLFSFTGANDAVTGGADVDLDGLPEQQDLQTFGLYSYAFNLTFGVTDPAKLAAALDLDADPTELAFAPGDGNNIQRLLNERNRIVTYTMGGIQVSGTIEELYDLTVSYAGGLKATSSNQFYISKDRETQLAEARANVSGVNLDEEFSQLINYQRAFEAAGRMIKVADELLAQVLGLVG